MTHLVRWDGSTVCGAVSDDAPMPLGKLHDPDYRDAVEVCEACVKATKGKR